ncbi:MAG: hypothetical protein O2892_02570 [Actinomycetota bacterium]|nr:hypothetical protein [Actinomycetota bacterium]MDA2947909.1 hypothetical protein [Actinomycetota bacterium]
MQRLKTSVAYALAMAAAPLAALIAPAHSLADDGCGPGMYFNIENNQCQYYAVIGPAGPGPLGPGPVGPGPVGPGPVGPGSVGPGPVGPGR